MGASVSGPRPGVFATFVLASALAVSPAPADDAAASPGADAPVVGTPIDEPGGPALTHFFAALERVERGVPGAVARVVHFGDSHTASNSFSGAVRDALQSRFGDAGSGFVLAARPWPSYDPPSVDVEIAGPWTVDRVRFGSHDGVADRMYGLAGVSARSDERGAAVEIATEGRAAAASLDLYYLCAPGGGSADVTLDGEHVARIETAADAPAPCYHRVVADDAPHRLRVELRGDGEVRLFGAAIDRPGPGVSYDALGVNGGRAPWLLEWNADVLAGNLARRDPDLVVLMFGTNEAEDPDVSAEEYGEEFAAVLRRVRDAVPDASCLVLAPPDMSPRSSPDSPGTPESLVDLIEAERSAAKREDCAFFDTFAAMGGAGSMESWAAKDPPLAARDGVHLTWRGYRAIAAAVAGALLDAYDRRDDAAADPEPPPR